jgi:hypothetical protein
VSAAPKVRTITLTDRPPVKVREDLWPVIASARRYDGQVECQANHLWHLTVRQHEDGRTLVYGSETSGPGGVYRGYEEARAGELLDAGVDVASAIIRVGTDARCHKAMQDDWYIVTAADLESYVTDYLGSDDEAITADAYSHWCAGTVAEEMPRGWDPADPEAQVLSRMGEQS